MNTAPMASTSWPELESTATTKAPEWSLRSESELHVERLEAKLDSIKKRNDRPSRHHQHQHEAPGQQPQGALDLDADEIQAGQEEADEGLWLLWNNKSTASSSKPAVTSQAQSRYHNATYGTSSIHRPSRSSSESEEEEGQDEDEEQREERLEVAKARAKHVEEYVVKDRTCSRTCCCVIS
ncbi:hypothetical protein BC939DRAFT_439350 [Gamsiella multidivaricata]|uniref:uncharacterized protein n=1 Tax=Gamsiella multidivaricata TaxID=101098 RepID=UPI002220430E|nr:uncharacterized protein BC939DRAFT_439350 [Gamsiella multidivaricata]KAI7830439.1 hypothetical protein BC939DRAFT_439350 [Gamsiella multidivaricata]